MNDVHFAFLFCDVKKLANRFVKIYIKDLRRKVRSIVQVTTESGSVDKSSPSLTVPRSPVPILKTSTTTTTTTAAAAANRSASNESRSSSQAQPPQQQQQQQQQPQSTSLISQIDNALSSYLQSNNNAFDLDKITKVCTHSFSLSLSLFLF